MQEIKLEVQVRDKIGTSGAKAIRREGAIPAVVYGGKKKPTVVEFDRRQYEHIRRHHHGELVFHLHVHEGEKKLRDYSAIVKEEQLHPVTDQVLHVDFKRISLKEEIEVSVALVATGEPIGVKRDSGSLEHGIWELDVICLPTAIPEEIKVDVSAMEIGDSIHVSDIALPAGVKTKHDPEAVAFHVAPPMKEEELEGEEEGADEPEVIKDKKDEKGDAEDGKADDAKAEAKE